MVNLLLDVAKGGLVVLDSTIDVPGDDGLLAALALVDGDESKVVKLLLVEGLGDEGSRVHVLAPREGIGELLLSGSDIVVVGAQELLEHNLCGYVIDVGELHTPHLLVRGLVENVIKTTVELGERRLWGRRASILDGFLIGGLCGSFSVTVSGGVSYSGSSGSLRRGSGSGLVLFGSHDDLKVDKMRLIKGGRKDRVEKRR